MLKNRITTVPFTREGKELVERIKVYKMKELFSFKLGLTNILSEHQTS